MDSQNIQNSEASIIVEEPTSTTEVATTGDTIKDPKTGEIASLTPSLPGTGVEILTSVKDIIFNKPDIEIFNAAVLYELTTMEGQRLFYAFRKSRSKFQSQCDIHISDSDGNDALRLMNPKKHPWKVFVKSGDAIIGSVRQTNWRCTSPRFILLDPTKQEIAIVRPISQSCFCLPNCCTCGVGFVAFEVVQRKDSKGAKLPRELVISRLAKGLVDHDRDDLVGSLGIDYFDSSLDVNTKCLVIAAAIFVDYRVFSSEKINWNWKIILGLAFLFVVIIFVLAIVFAVIQS